MTHIMPTVRRAARAVLCDMCTGEDRKPAKKTCMKCEISMCVQHLQAHLTTPVLLQTHPLTEPVASGDAGLGGTTKCPKHGKLLEYYCLDDRICVCVDCAIEDQHRLHNMKTFSTAHKELMEKLNDANQQAVLVKADSQSAALEKWEKIERMKLEHSSVRLIEAVTNLRDVVLTSVQSSVSARMKSIKTSKSSMRAAQEVKDPFRFLQMYSQVHQDVEKAKAADLRKGLEPGTDRDKLVQEIRQSKEKIVKQAGQFWGSLMTLVDPENHEELTAAASDLTFDPRTFGSGMLLSADKRKVFYSSGLQEQCSATLLIRSTQEITHIQRWMISLSPDFDWTIGLCDERFPMDMMDTYGLSCKGNRLSFLSAPEQYQAHPMSKRIVETRLRSKPHVIGQLSQTLHRDLPRPEMVEVFWDSSVPSLSFFNRNEQHQREEIIKIQLKNNYRLIPFVQLEKENAKNVAQHHWRRCQCGRAYSKDSNGYNDGFRNYSQQRNCSCGAIIGDICIAEVVCELH